MVHGKDTRCIQFSLCSRKKLTNFGSQRMVVEPFADGAAQVRSPVYTYVHLFCKLFASGLLGVLVYMRLYKTLGLNGIDLICLQKGLDLIINT